MQISFNQKKYLSKKNLQLAEDDTTLQGNPLYINDNRPARVFQAGSGNYQSNNAPLVKMNYVSNKNASEVTQLRTKNGVIQLGKNPYGRDVGTFSWENLLTLFFELLDYLAIGFFEDLSRLINLHNAHDAEHAVQGIAHRRIEAWLRFILRVMTRSGLAILLLHFLPSGMLGYYLTLLIMNALNWLYERLMVMLGEYAHHEGQGSLPANVILSYLRFVEGVEPESADYVVRRRSDRRSGDTGRAMGGAEQVAGGRLSAQTASGGLWYLLSRFFNYEWGHRQADSHRGQNISSNLGSESMGANSQEMVGERFALDQNRVNPGNVRRRNFALRFAGSLFDRIRRTTVFLNNIPHMTETIYSDRGPMTERERSTAESDYENQRSYMVGLNLRNGIIMPVLTAVLFLLIRLIFSYI